MVVARWVAVLLLFPLALAADNGRLLFTSMADGTVGVIFPESILRDDEVRPQLTSGLTITFAAVARNGDRARTGARVEIRYDLWEDKYLVRKTEFDGSRSSASFRSFDDLSRWWRSTPLRLLRTGAISRRVDVELRVLPFSAAESRDAREWLEKGAGVTQRSAQPGFADPRPSTDRAAAEPRLPSAGVIDALIGTSLEAKPLITFRWRAELPFGEGR